jgi:hypothetical protein
MKVEPQRQLLEGLLDRFQILSLVSTGTFNLLLPCQ